MVLKSFFISTLSPLRCFRTLIFWKSSQDDMWSSKSLCSLWSKFLTPLNSYVENLMPDMMILGSGAFGRWLGQEWSPHEWNECPNKMTLESSLSLPTTWRHSEKALALNQEEDPHLLCLDLGLPHLQNCERQTSVVYQPPRLWYFATQPKQTKTPISTKNKTDR